MGAAGVLSLFTYIDNMYVLAPGTQQQKPSIEIQNLKARSSFLSTRQHQHEPGYQKERLLRLKSIKNTYSNYPCN